MKRNGGPCSFAIAGVCRWAAVVLLGLAGCIASALATGIEFASTEASGRGIHPVRLSVDTDGPPRLTPLRFEAPPGTRFMRALPLVVPEGAGAQPVQVFHLLVLPEAAAGALILRGSLGERPLEARIAVTARPDFRVFGTTQKLQLGFGNTGIPAKLVVRNRGNTPLSLRAFSQTGSDGPTVVIADGTFDLPAGGEREVSLVILPPARSRITSEHAVAILFEGRSGGFARTDPMVIRTLFVPENPDPGPLFAVLSGSLEVGVLSDNSREQRAAQVRLSGEIHPGVTLEAHALDGANSVLGSQLGLAGRDNWHVSLNAPGWHATAGETRAPSLGFLAPGIYGRGFTGGVRNPAWIADIFALRDRFAGSVREAAGVRVAGPGESWESGVILQRSREFGFASEDRVGAFAGSHWNWSGFKGHTNVALAGSDGAGASLGLSQTLEFEGERARVNAQLEHAEQGFFLQDQSSERQSILGEWKAGRGWTLLAGIDRSEQTGRLRTLLQERDNLGRPTDPAAIIELINEIATRQESYQAGARREFKAGTLSTVFRRQERAGELDVLREFVEDAVEAEWTSRPDDPWWRVGATVGRESGPDGSARFAEFRGNAYWNPTQWSRLEGNVRWTAGLSGEPQGFRREGVHGQITGSVSPSRDWRAEIRVEGYDYADFEPRSRIGALVRFPIGNRGWSGAVEWGRDTHSGDESAWLVVRAPLSFEMPWRPLRGAISGRVTSAATGAGLPSVLVQSGRHRAMSDATGRYQLPAMDPGVHVIGVQSPAGWTQPSTVPGTVRIVAGKSDSLNFALIELGTLRGEIVILDPEGAVRPTPAGVVVAEGTDGDIHETLAFRGIFTLRLPPGAYKVKFVSELPDDVGRQLEAKVTVGGNGPAEVRLEAREQARRIRRTLTSSGEGSGGRR